jgi:head-tail adaptor
VTAAGTLIELMAFEAPVSSADGHGGTLTGWEEQFRTRASLRNLRGGETVQASRLRGVQPVVLTIRAQSAASAVTPSWRVRDVREGTVYNVRAIVRSDDRAFYEITAESGVAV